MPPPPANPSIPSSNGEDPKHRKSHTYGKIRILSLKPSAHVSTSRSLSMVARRTDCFAPPIYLFPLAHPSRASEGALRGTSSFHWATCHAEPRGQAMKLTSQLVSIWLPSASGSRVKPGQGRCQSFNSLRVTSVSKLLEHSIATSHMHTA